jgi:hypothetical protein
LRYKQSFNANAPPPERGREILLGRGEG